MTFKSTEYYKASGKPIPQPHPYLIPQLKIHKEIWDVWWETQHDEKLDWFRRTRLVSPHDLDDLYTKFSLYVSNLIINRCKKEGVSYMVFDRKKGWIDENAIDYWCESGMSCKAEPKKRTEVLYNPEEKVAVCKKCWGDKPIPKGCS